MENYMILAYILLAVLAVFCGITLLIPYLVKKGIDISGILTTTGSALEAADKVVDGMQAMFPQKDFNIVDTILYCARKAVDAAEQMYKASKIAAEDRKQTATEIVYDMLTVAGIDVTDDLKRVVDGMIECAVFGLPSTSTPKLRCECETLQSVE